MLLIHDEKIKTPEELKFQLWEIVYLKSDLKFKTPMTIIGYSSMDDTDYICTWLTTQKMKQQAAFAEEALIKK